MFRACAMSVSEMSLFVEDPNLFGERNRVKIQSNVIQLPRDPTDLILAEINIPSRHLETVLGHLKQLETYLRRQTGIILPLHKPLVSVQASFLLKNKKNPNLTRVFTGTYQKKYQEQNVLAKGKTIANLNQLLNLVRDATTPSNIANKLDSGIHFPTSEWEFAGLVSVVLIVNCKAKIIPRREFMKTFYPDLEQ